MAVLPTTTVSGVTLIDSITGTCVILSLQPVFSIMSRVNALTRNEVTGKIDFICSWLK
jgi:hypothetical protein